MCTGFDMLLFESLGEVKPNLNLLQPGMRGMRALNCDWRTGNCIGGKIVSSLVTVTCPAIGFEFASVSSPIVPRIKIVFV